VAYTVYLSFWTSSLHEACLLQKYVQLNAAPNVQLIAKSCKQPGVNGAWSFGTSIYTNFCSAQPLFTVNG
jgi:hypothetical protein